MGASSSVEAANSNNNTVDISSDESEQSEAEAACVNPSCQQQCGGPGPSWDFRHLPVVQGGQEEKAQLRADYIEGITGGWNCRCTKCSTLARENKEWLDNAFENWYAFSRNTKREQDVLLTEMGNRTQGTHCFGPFGGHKVCFSALAGFLQVSQHRLGRCRRGLKDMRFKENDIVDKALGLRKETAHAFSWLWAQYMNAAEYIPNTDPVPGLTAKSDATRQDLEKALAAFVLDPALRDEVRRITTTSTVLPKRMLPPGNLSQLHFEYLA
ncbi:MAG: hypothetical protein GY938_30555, partial [Ketobacter sp.]|nr:hypothetical protein [Ketobacter sp.]